MRGGSLANERGGCAPPPGLRRLIPRCAAAPWRTVVLRPYRGDVIPGTIIFVLAINGLPLPRALGLGFTLAQFRYISPLAFVLVQHCNCAAPSALFFFFFAGAWRLLVFAGFAGFALATARFTPGRAIRFAWPARTCATVRAINPFTQCKYKMSATRF